MSEEIPQKPNEAKSEAVPPPESESALSKFRSVHRLDQMREIANELLIRKRFHDSMVASFTRDIHPFSIVQNHFKPLSSVVDTSIYAPSEELSKELGLVRQDARDLAQKLEATTRESEEYKEAQRKLEAKVQELEQKTLLTYILSNIHPDAQQKIFQCEAFRRLFEGTTTCESYVLSIDLRRSTELMLKAREPELFARFVRDLCVALSEMIIANYGVFDKFTGDGVLAYFPDFYSGPDAGFLALDCAHKAHTFFREHYRSNRNCFTSVLDEVGLGVGIDFGKTYMVKIQGSLTLVGTPVVYACRFSGAKAGDTLLNQPAYESIFENYRSCFNFEETLISVKNEGDTIAYRVASNKADYAAQKPDWDSLIAKYGSRSSDSTTGTTSA